MADGGWRMEKWDDEMRMRMESGWKNADDKIQMKNYE